jgi:hypothetical protein
VLAIHGQSDFVASEHDSRAVVDAVNAGRPGKAAFVALSGIDGNLGRATDAEESFLAGPGSDFNPVIIETIDAWAKKLMGRSST